MPLHTTKADTFLSFIFLGFLGFLPCGLHTFDPGHIRLLGGSVKETLVRKTGLNEEEKAGHFFCSFSFPCLS